MLHASFGIQNKFAQGGSVFRKTSCSLILVGACDPDLSQEHQAVGLVVYVWKSEAPLRCRNREIHSTTKQRLGLGMSLSFNPEQAHGKGELAGSE